MVRRPELLLTPDSCEKVSCDDIGRCPVLWGLFFRIREGQTRLFHRYTCDPSPWCSLYQDLEEGRIKGFLQRLFHQYEGAPDVGGNPLHECPLLLE